MVVVQNKEGAQREGLYTIRDNGIQMDREIQNPVYECKTTAHPLNPFAT